MFKRHHLLFYLLIALALVAGLFYANPVRSTGGDVLVGSTVWGAFIATS